MDNGDNSRKQNNIHDLNAQWAVDEQGIRSGRIGYNPMRIRKSMHEIADTGLTLSKLSVAASLLGDLAGR